MRKIGLLGGSFDPIHNGHIKMAEFVRKEKGLDEVWFIVAYDQPLKSSHFESFDSRFNLVKIALSKYPHLKAIDIEKDLEKPSYTFNTVSELNRLYANDEFFWILGDDNLENLSKWYKIDELRAMIEFIFVSRDDVESSEQMLYFKDDGSSTKVRSGDLSHLDEDVLKYMYENKLYLEALVRSNLSKKRADHVMRTVEVAMEIANAHNLDERKVYIATILHDFTKELDKEEELKIMNEYFSEHIHYHYKVYHQFTGAYIAQEKFKIEDLDILNAIMHHTTGTSDETISKVVYLADKLERGRPYEVEHYIELSKKNIDEAFTIVKAEAEANR